MAGGDIVDNAGHAPDIVGPRPRFSGERGTGREGSVDIGERVGFDIRARQPGPHEHAQNRRDLLLQVRRNAAAGRVVPDSGEIGRPPVNCASATASL